MSLTPTPNFSQIETTAKTFWNRKEGKFSMKMLLIGGGGLLLIGFWFREVIENFLQFLMTIATNGVALFLILAALAVITSPIWNSQVRNYCWNAFQMVMGDAYKLLVAKDPIKILRNTSILAQQELKTISDCTTGLSGSKEQLTTDLQNEMSNIQKQKSMATEAQRQVIAFTQQMNTAKNMNDRQEAALSADRMRLAITGYKEAAGWSLETIKQLRPQLQRTEVFYDRMSRVRNLAEFKIRSMNMQADMYEKRHKSMENSQRYLGAVNRFFKGDPNQQALNDMAIDRLNEEAANTIGAMNDFNSWSARMLADKDVQMGAMSGEADKIFDQIEAKLALPGMTGLASTTAVANATQSVVNEATQIPDMLADFPDPDAPIPIPISSSSKKAQ